MVVFGNSALKESKPDGSVGKVLAHEDLSPILSTFRAGVVVQLVTCPCDAKLEGQRQVDFQGCQTVSLAKLVSSQAQ